MSTNQQSRIEPGQTWRRGRVEREVIAIEREMGREPVIVAKQIRRGPGLIICDVSAAVTGRADLYAADSDQVAHAVREWAIENGDNPQLRIALCGYEGEHAMPDSWECVAWKAQGGFGSQSAKAGRANAKRERIWFSPHCLRLGLFGALAPEQNTAILFGGADELR